MSIKENGFTVFIVKICNLICFYFTGICKVKCNSLSTVLFCDFDHSLVLLKVLFGSLEPSDMAGCPGTTNNVSCPAVDFTNQLIKSCSGRMNCLVDPTNFQQCNPLSRVALKTDYKCAHSMLIFHIYFFYLLK